MPNLPPLPTLHELLRIFNLKACGQLSQNFLLQPWSIERLIKCAGPLENSNVLEVGPGPGGLTRCLLKKKPHHLAVVELDSRFLLGLEQLKDAAKSMQVKMDIYHQDILKFNYDNVFPLIKEEVHPDQAWDNSKIDSNQLVQRKTHIIGNLPFSITPPLLVQWLHDISEKRGLWTYARVPLTITFQEELAHRMIAEENDPERSRFSILCQSLCQVKIKKIISGSSFLPKAKVSSAVIYMEPRLEPLIKVPYPYLYKLVKAIFQYKSKTALFGIETLFPPEHCKSIIRLFSVSGVDPGKRPIELTIEEVGLLAEEYHKMCTEIPDIFVYNFSTKKASVDFRERRKLQRLILDGKHINPETVRGFMSPTSENVVSI